MTESRSYEEQRHGVISLMAKEGDMTFAEAEAKFDSSGFAEGTTAQKDLVVSDQKLFDFIVANGHSEQHAISEVEYCRRGRGVTEPFVPTRSAA